jgi:hypothetical protein
MKRILLVFIVSFLFLISSTKIVADMAPSPSMDIEITGFEEDYVLDVLVPSDSVYPLPDHEFSWKISSHHYMRDDCPDTLNGYQDADGYASGSLYGEPHRTSVRQLDDDRFEVEHSDDFTHFKVALIGADDTIIVSDAFEKTEMEATFTFDLSNASFDDVSDVDGMQVLLVENRIEEIYSGPTDSGALNAILKTVLRIVLTLAIELGILYLFAYRMKHTYKVAGITNIATQSLLTMLYIIWFYFLGSPFSAFMILIAGETLVFLIEMGAYPLLFKEKARRMAVLYALAANLVSMLIGLVLLPLI